MFIARAQPGNSALSGRAAFVRTQVGSLRRSSEQSRRPAINIALLRSGSPGVVLSLSDFVRGV